MALWSAPIAPVYLTSGFGGRRAFYRGPPPFRGGRGRYGRGRFLAYAEEMKNENSQFAGFTQAEYEELVASQSQLNDSYYLDDNDEYYPDDKFYADQEPAYNNDAAALGVIWKRLPSIRWHKRSTSTRRKTASTAAPVRFCATASSSADSRTRCTVLACKSNCNQLAAARG